MKVLIKILKYNIQCILFLDKVCDTLTVTQEDFMIALNTFFY